MAVYQSLSVTQVSQNQEENSSRVRILWQSTQTGGSYNETRRTARYTVSVNGGTPETYTVSYILPKQSTAVILDITVTVLHDSKGQAEVEVTTWMNTNISAGVVELSQKLIPDTIARAGTLLAADGIIGGTAKLAITRKSAEHTYSIAYAFGELSGYVDGEGQVQQEETRFSADSVDFLIPLSFYSQIPNAKSGQCQLTLRTYLGDTPVGQPQNATFTASAEEAACLPEVTGQVMDINEATKALTGDETVLVPYASQMLCTVTSKAKNGTTIVRQTIAGQEVSDGRLLLTDPQTEKILFSAEDARGYISYSTVELARIPYQKPSFDVQAVRTDPVSGKALLTVSGQCFAGSFGQAENTLSASYSTDGVTFTPIDSLMIQDNQFAFSVSLENMDYASVYVITVRVWDRLFSVEKQAVLKKTLPVFDWGEEDFAFHVPVTMDTPLSLQNGGTGRGAWQESGVVMKDDTGLTAIPAAPGAFYAPEGETPRFDVLPVEYGGTGSKDSRTACENLGLTLPMELGQEYATAHRWMGKTVYTKLIDFGSLPNTKAKSVEHGAEASQVLGCRGTTSIGRALPWGGAHYYRADLFCDSQKVYIDTESDQSGQTAVVQIWYIK